MRANGSKGEPSAWVSAASVPVTSAVFVQPSKAWSICSGANRFSLSDAESRLRGVALPSIQTHRPNQMTRYLSELGFDEFDVRLTKESIFIGASN